MLATALPPEHSLIVPIYKNEGSIPDLLSAVLEIDRAVGGTLEAVFVVDSSPDASYALLAKALNDYPVRAQLLLLSRNFGSFAAIREGMAHARGRSCAVMAADLQEPPELMIEFFRVLDHEPFDLAVGTRSSRRDPWFNRMASRIFWWFYRRLIQSQLPRGGIDVFACNEVFRDQLLKLDEANSSLIGQLLWLGYRRKEIPYERRERRHGRSAWTFSRKLRYLMNSVFAFSDLPITALVFFGGLGLTASVILAALIGVARISGWVTVPGYAATALIVLFFAALNMLGLGIIGVYAWRGYENTKHRPHALVLQKQSYDGKQPE